MPLNPTGRVQAEEAGRRLATLVDDAALLPYVSSPLERTRHTMEILRRTLDLTAEAYALDDRLKELTFGAWEGLTWREVRARDAAGAARRERDKWHYVPPDGESYAMLAERLRPFLDDVAQDTVVVSHGGVARALLALCCRVPEHVAPRIDIWQGKVLVIESGEYRWA